ncbi:oxidoreductase family protein [Paucisalibacillus globulus]|uniref:oxidoreductase family protein n=1 Tax=Paucisalibacillus globulus TaxID=351095 RepID=UPI000BB79BE2|nr:oxidoreductase family protein [Paucisalibacillus globulus]
MKSVKASEITIDLDILHMCVKKILKKEDFLILNWRVNPIKSRTQNFTTSGIYRLCGLARVEGADTTWSLIIKVVEQEAEEKNNPNHFNYWKREALVFKSGLLNELPKVIQTPDCYKIEVKSDTEIWLWMEEIKENNSREFSLAEFFFIAKQMGLFHGTFASGKFPLPQEEWISRNWLKSWIDGCDLYAPRPSKYYPKITEPSKTIDTILKTYLDLRQNEKKYLNKLNNLPRVLSHQDLSKQNMYISNKSQRLILIDWQFLSISGLGEDIGRLFGLAISQDDIPITKAWEYQEQLFNSYLNGLKQVGWNGNPLLVRYGFCVAVAFRSIWEVPKLTKIIAQNSPARYGDEIDKYTQIVLLQLRFAEEAADIFEKI